MLVNYHADPSQIPWEQLLMLFLTQVGDPGTELIPQNYACIFGIALKAYTDLLWLFLSSYVPIQLLQRFHAHGWC